MKIMLNQFKLGESCHWKSANSSSLVRIGFPYSTCTSSISSCNDGVCDSLERIQQSVCPQDCVKKSKIKMALTLYTLTTGHGILSTKTANMTCRCDSSSCHCFHHVFQYTEPPRIARTSLSPDSVCDDHCVLAVTLTASIAILLCLLVTGLWGKRWRMGREKFQHPKDGGQDFLDFSDDTRSNTSTIATNSTILYPGHVVQHPQHLMIDKKFEFPRRDLILQETIGEGEFGRVVSAQALNLNGQSGRTHVAVKMLKPQHTACEIQDLLSEYNLLKEVDHPHVIKLLGACTDRRGPVYLIMEFAKHGSLRNYLLRSRCHSEGLRPQSRLSSNMSGGSNSTATSGIGSTNSTSEEELYIINQKDIISFAWQIAKGMLYLADMKLVHRDLATRNILLSDAKICKVSDFGLTRDVYIDEAYWKKGSGKLPIKWMAPESLTDHLYTTKSDVWGFGILLWELVTLGKSPYPGVSPDQLLGLLQSGYRMARPAGCSSVMYSLMVECWHGCPDRRPSFRNLASKLENILENSEDYLEIEKGDTIVNNDGYAEQDNYTNENDPLINCSPECGPAQHSGYLTPDVCQDTEEIREFSEDDNDTAGETVEIKTFPNLDQSVQYSSVGV